MLENNFLLNSPKEISFVGPKRSLLHDKEFFLKIFDFNKWFKNKIEDNDEKICSRFSETVSHKSILCPMVFTETSRQRRR